MSNVKGTHAFNVLCLVYLSTDEWKYSVLKIENRTLSRRFNVPYFFAYRNYNLRLSKTIQERDFSLVNCLILVIRLYEKWHKYEKFSLFFLCLFLYRLVLLAEAITDREEIPTPLLIHVPHVRFLTGVFGVWFID